MPIPLIAEIIPQNDAPFALLDDSNLRGSYQVVATIVEMNAINSDNRKAGMQVFCQDSSIAYTLAPDLLTWNPTEVPSAPTPTFVYTQVISTAVWSIRHSLNKYPDVTVVDSINRMMQGEVTYVDMNNVVVSFTGPFSGMAYLN